MITIVALNRDSEGSLGVGGNAFLAGFGLLFAAVAYWSGSWLFITDEKAAPPRVASNPRGEIAEDYRGEWRSNSPNNIIRVLSANNVRGCGEFHHKPSTRNSGEYLVYCTPDGRNWTAYIVWPNVNRISGPARPDPNIRPPR